MLPWRKLCFEKRPRARQICNHLKADHSAKRLNYLYTKGEVLYKNYFSEEDHIRLAKKITANLNNVKWIMTYDDCDLIKEIYKNYNPNKFNLQYYAGKKRIGNELLISNLKDLES